MPWEVEAKSWCYFLEFSVIVAIKMGKNVHRSVSISKNFKKREKLVNM